MLDLADPTHSICPTCLIHPRSGDRHVVATGNGRTANRSPEPPGAGRQPPGGRWSGRSEGRGWSGRWKVIGLGEGVIGSEGGIGRSDGDRVRHAVRDAREPQSLATRDARPWGGECRHGQGRRNRAMRPCAICASRGRRARRSPGEPQTRHGQRRRTRVATLRDVLVMGRHARPGRRRVGRAGPRSDGDLATVVSGQRRPGRGGRPSRDDPDPNGPTRNGPARNGPARGGSRRFRPNQRDSAAKPLTGKPSTDDRSPDENRAYVANIVS